jgi:hypothetical protein
MEVFSIACQFFDKQEEEMEIPIGDILYSRKVK